MLNWIKNRKNPYVHGTEFTKDETSGLLWFYLQGLDPQGFIDVYTREAHEGDEPPPIEAVRPVFTGLDRYLFNKLIEPQVPQTPEVRALFPEDDTEYIKKVALIILETAYAQPTGVTFTVHYNGHRLMQLHKDVSMEMKKHYVRKAGQENTPEGMVALPTFKFFTERRIGTDERSEPALFIMMLNIMQEWLKEQPLVIE